MEKILVAIDGSSESRKAAEKAIELAKKYNSEIIFLTVVKDYSDTHFGLYEVLKQEEINEAGMENGRKVLDSFIKDLDCASIKYKKEVVQGIAYDKIIDIAREGNYDLIVVGHRGLSPIKRAFLGSVAKRVIEDALVSVMVVK